MRILTLLLTSICLITPTLSFSEPTPTNNQTLDEILKQQGLDEKTRAALKAVFNQHQLTLKQDEFGNPTIISKADKQGSYSIKITRRQGADDLTDSLDQSYSERLVKLEQEISQLKQTLNDMSQLLSQLKNQ
ncbi:hypothetical protein [Spartinivicinus ruber]|uniref:hypothetical protein n=1 Tax=Spartinivicinus ruber TaxID=2683272 RepID=UPI0013D4FDBF|nr:hypothetical protein [Spartinivicinus ruber]